jgi:hypothetical protein
MYITPLITEEYIKNNTPIGKNVDIELIESNIQYAQEAYIQDILGTDLYNDIQTKYLNRTLSPDEETLVLYIKPALAYRAGEVSLPFMRGQLRNKGVVNMNSENSTQDDSSYMRYLRDELRGRSEYLEQVLKKYLCNNSALFPLYTFSNDEINPSQSGYDCDLFIGDVYYCRNCECYNCNCYKN